MFGLKRILAITAVAAMMAGGASASTFQHVGNFTGNGCTGQRDDNNFDFDGNGFAACSYNGSDVIAKFNKNGNLEDLNSKYVFEESWITINSERGNKSGYWSYTPTPGEAVGITAAYFKGGNGYSLYEWTGEGSYFGNDGLRFAWRTELGGLSNAVFFDTDATPIPVPAAGLLLITAFGGLGIAARRRRKAA